MVILPNTCKVSCRIFLLATVLGLAACEADEPRSGPHDRNVEDVASPDAARSMTAATILGKVKKVLHPRAFIIADEELLVIGKTPFKVAEGRSSAIPFLEGDQVQLTGYAYPFAPAVLSQELGFTIPPAWNESESKTVFIATDSQLLPESLEQVFAGDRAQVVELPDPVTDIETLFAVTGEHPLIGKKVILRRAMVQRQAGSTGIWIGPEPEKTVLVIDQSGLDTFDQTSVQTGSLITVSGTVQAVSKRIRPSLSDQDWIDLVSRGFYIAATHLER